MASIRESATQIGPWHKPSAPVQYYRAFHRFRNWPLYVLGRYLRKERRIFRTRIGDMRIEVPRGLLPVFKEVAIYDVYRLQQLGSTLGRAPIVLDIGANAGFFSLFFLAMSPASRMYSFEPLPANFEALRRNRELNAAYAPRWRIFERAVVGRPQRSSQIYCEEGSSVSFIASMYADWLKKPARAVNVEAVSIAQILEQQKLDRVDLLKIDCEGAEYEILFETRRKDLARIRNIVLETHDFPGLPGTHSDMVRFLIDQGYRIERAALEAKTNCAVWARRDP